ncbi:MAG: hypothetical protein MUO72_18465 [Bacteroidales bacterium]|nr:hypothetical protein [Bacteroidales bacterium]
MIKFERLLFNVLFGSVIPILFFMIFWWSSLLFTEDNGIIMITSLSGLCLGIVISLLIKFTRKPDIYRLSGPVLILIYLFYNAGIFGMFMGMPVFNLIPGMIAGFYWTKRLIHSNETTDLKNKIHRTSSFTAIVIGFVCLFSAAIALISESTPGDLKRMLHLPFNISQLLLIVVIITGGLFLIIIQYFLTKVIMQRTFGVVRNIDDRWPI